MKYALGICVYILGEILKPVDGKLCSDQPSTSSLDDETTLSQVDNAVSLDPVCDQTSDKTPEDQCSLKPSEIGELVHLLTPHCSSWKGGDSSC